MPIAPLLPPLCKMYTAAGLNSKFQAYFYSTSTNTGVIAESWTHLESLPVTPNFTVTTFKTVSASDKYNSEKEAFRTVLNFKTYVLRNCLSPKKVFQKKIYFVELLNSIDILFLRKGNILLTFLLKTLVKYHI